MGASPTLRGLRAQEEEHSDQKDGDAGQDQQRRPLLVDHLQRGVGGGGQAKVQWRGGFQASATVPGRVVQGQRAGHAAVLWLGKAADTGVAQRRLRPTVAHRTAAGQPAPCLVGAVRLGR